MSDLVRTQIVGFLTHRLKCYLHGHLKKDLDCTRAYQETYTDELSVVNAERISCYGCCLCQ